MASHVEVVSTELRRAKVKVTPGTYLIDVLNEACDKLHLSSDKYLLKYKQKTIDLTGPFRTSGLSAGAKLELVVKSSSPSVVAIKLEVRSSTPGSTSTSTFTKKLPSSMALWQVLRQFEAENAGLLVTARGAPRRDTARGGGAGQLYHEAPVVSIMGREYTALAELQKTLSQCGVNSGSVLLRVEFRPTERPLHEAMEEISGYFKDVDEAPRQKPNPNPESETKPDATVQTATNTNGEGSMDIDTAPTTSTSTARDTPSNTTSSAEAEAAEPEPEPALEPSAESSSTATDPLQPSAVFLAPTSSVPAAAAIEEPDSAYEPSIAQMQQRQQALQARSYNTRLKSDAELAAQEAAQAARLAEVRTLTVKVRFPDGTLAQWTADQMSTGAFLYAAVRAVMRRPGEPFRLVLPGPPGFAAGGGAIEDDAARSLIAGYRLRGNVLLHLLWGDAASPAARKEPFLRADVAGRAVKMVVPDVAAAAVSGGDDAAGGVAVVGGKEEHKKEGGKGGDGLKLPKWLKLPGKK